MVFRDLPSMHQRGASNWPPLWIGTGANYRSRIKGEMGTLKSVWISQDETRCILTIDYNGISYVGSMLFDDASVCQSVYKLFCEHRGRPIAEIGGIKVNMHSSEEKASPQ